MSVLCITVTTAVPKVRRRCLTLSPSSSFQHALVLLNIAKIESCFFNTGLHYQHNTNTSQFAMACCLDIKVLHLNGSLFSLKTPSLGFLCLLAQILTLQYIVLYQRQLLSEKVQNICDDTVVLFTHCLIYNLCMQNMHKTLILQFCGLICFILHF